MTKCKCGDREADKCPEPWEPGCDLGNNEKYAEVVDWPFEPLYDLVNPGAYTEAARLAAKGALGEYGRYHVTATPGADPKAVELETRRMFDRLNWGAYWPIYDGGSRVVWAFEYLLGHWRNLTYRWLRQKKFEETLK